MDSLPQTYIDPHHFFFVDSSFEYIWSYRWFCFCSSFVREVVVWHWYMGRIPASQSTPTYKLRKLHKLKIFFRLDGKSSPKRGLFIHSPQNKIITTSLHRNTENIPVGPICRFVGWLICYVVTCSRHQFLNYELMSAKKRKRTIK